jgi:hypothetical protein
MRSGWISAWTITANGLAFNDDDDDDMLRIQGLTSGDVVVGMTNEETILRWRDTANKEERTTRFILNFSRNEHSLAFNPAALLHVFCY